MRAALAMIVGLTLAACSHPKGPEAEEQYGIVQRSFHTPEQLCQQARAVAQGYLDDHNQDKYTFWNMRAENDCYHAR